MIYEEKHFIEPFKYCEYIIKDFLEQAHFDEVNMLGMCRTLEKIKDNISHIFTEASYMTYDIEYHGWQGEAAENMHNIKDAIVKRLLEIYVICQMGLGNSLYEEDENESI